MAAKGQGFVIRKLPGGRWSNPLFFNVAQLGVGLAAGACVRACAPCSAKLLCGSSMHLRIDSCNVHACLCNCKQSPACGAACERNSTYAVLCTCAIDGLINNRDRASVHMYITAHHLALLPEGMMAPPWPPGRCMSPCRPEPHPVGHGAAFRRVDPQAVLQGQARDQGEGASGGSHGPGAHPASTQHVFLAARVGPELLGRMRMAQDADCATAVYVM